MYNNKKSFKLLISLLLILTCPLRALAADTFAGETPDAGGVSQSVSPVGDDAAEKDLRYLKKVEIHGTNVVSPELILEKLNLKSGDVYDRDAVQNGLRNVYSMGYFTEKMRAIPVTNTDGTVTLKIILEENAPVTDFTIEGNTVVSTEEILAPLLSMKGKPQNISQLNDAIAKIQNIYTSKGYILSRVDSVTDDPDGTVNITIKEGTVNSIAIAGNEKTKDFVIARNILTEPGTVYNENQIKEDLERLYATQAF